MASLKSQRAYKTLVELSNVACWLDRMTTRALEVEGCDDIAEDSVERKKVEELLKFLEQQRLRVEDMEAKLVPVAADAIMEHASEIMRETSEHVDKAVKR